jgi:glycosyltransferase involved in cell wall biosynthesis
MKFPIMRYICDTQDSGYGNAARGYIQALKTLGIDGSICRVVPVMAPTAAPAPMDVPEESHGPFTPQAAAGAPGVGAAVGGVFESDDPFNPYIMGSWPGDDLINIVHLNPGMAHTYYTPIGGRYNILVTAWETDRLTRRSYKLGGEERTMVQDVNDFDEVWVPTTSLKSIFEASGVTKPIFVIPHAIREEVLAIPPKKTGKPIGKDVPVGFYAVGPWNARKNHVDLIRAYWATRWSIQDRVRLQLFTLPVLRDTSSVEAHEWIANDAIRNLKEAAPQNKLDLPALNLMAAPRRYMQHIKQAHIANHVFITASRGEGFCLPALDAAALGNHVVGGFPALKDLAEHAPGLVTVLGSRKVPITPMPEVSGYEIDHEWWESSLYELTAEFVALRQWVQNDGDLSMDQEVQAVRDNYCPVTIGKLIQARLEHAADVVESSGW